MWRPAVGCGLSTGAEKGAWLVEFITRTWEELGRPCSERAVDPARACARRRMAAHDDERAVLLHGDVHQWNARCVREGGDRFKLVDSDGLLAEAEYDLEIRMREDPAERVSTGLCCTSVDLQPAGREMLEVAERIAAAEARRAL